MFTPNPIQKKILKLLIVDGYTQGQAAHEINRSRETVKLYCAELRNQLGVDSFYQVIAIAVFRGWVSAPPSDQ
jgi:DNA-binding NarL/FixJ family response regulator